MLNMPSTTGGIETKCRAWGLHKGRAVFSEYTAELNVQNLLKINIV